MVMKILHCLIWRMGTFRFPWLSLIPFGLKFTGMDAGGGGIPESLSSSRTARLLKKFAEGMDAGGGGIPESSSSSRTLRLLKRYAGIGAGAGGGGIPESSSSSMTACLLKKFAEGMDAGGGGIPGSSSTGGIPVSIFERVYYNPGNLDKKTLERLACERAGSGS